MDLMLWPWGPAAIICFFLSWYCFGQAMENLADGHPDSIPRIMFWWGRRRRNNFTQLGWRYMMAAFCSSLAMALLIIIGCLP